MEKIKYFLKEYIFIKQSKTYETVKKNVPNRNWAKVIILILNVISIYISTYLVVCMQELIDAVTNAITTQDLTVFKTTICITLGVIFFNTIISIFNSIFNFYIGMDFVSNTSKFVFESFYKQEFNFPKQEGNDSGIVASKLMSETDDVAGWLMSGALGLWQDFISIFIKFGMLYKYSPLLSVVCASFVCFAFAVTRKLNKKLAYINKQVYAAGSELTQFFVQASKSFVDVKQMQKEDEFVSKMLDMLHNQVYYHKKRAMYWGMLYSSIFSLSSIIFPMTVLIGGLYLAIRGRHTIGEIMAMYQLVKMAQDPLNALAGDVSSWKSMMILTERLDCFMPPENDNEEDKVEFQNLENITFDCEKFAYPNGEDILKNIHFEIKKGDIFCLKGRTGIGKSTITSLLMRFNKLESPSSVKFNGIDINNYTYASFYKNVNILNQMPYIFQDSLMKNITMGDKYTEEEINEVIATAQLESFVKEYGFDYELKEDAGNISGGQKQRIGLARLLLRKPQLLVLDEPTAALDEITSANLVKSLKDFSSKYGMTIFVISHSNVFDDYASEVFNLNDKN